ncbi:MAG: aminomethyl-transferring glycine dehydrogenase subunit GcvPA [Rhodospirillales bacterium]
MRYLPLTEADRHSMLGRIGAASVDELFRDVPAKAYHDGDFDLPDHKGELEVERILRGYAGENLGANSVPCFLGAGAYHHHVPSSVDYLIQRGEFLTAYTPYQPEIAQGTLQYVFEFQTQVAMLTGMEVANAGMYDGATSCSEAVAMAMRVTKRNKAILSGWLHPHYREVVETSAGFLGQEIVSSPADPLKDGDLAAQIDGETACVVVQNPGLFGHVRDYSALAAACHEQGALLVMIVTEAVSLGAIKSPGEMGADIVAGEGQSFGVQLGYGGPYVGLFATRLKFVRNMPGRLCGETVDADGKRGYVLTLSTREQHIRREKATSNICTASGLCALAFTIHVALLGEAGLDRLAHLNHAAAVTLAEKLEAVEGVSVVTDAFFNEFTIRLPKPAAGVVEALAAKNILGGVPASRMLPHAGLEDCLILAATETATDDDMDRLVAGLKEALA